MDKLNAAATSLQKIQEGMGVNMAGTLQPLCSESQQADLFLFVGHLTLRARRSVDMYGVFLIHFQRIVFSERDGWVHFQRIAFSEESGSISTTSHRRSRTQDSCPSSTAFDCQDVRLRAARERTVSLHNQGDRVVQGSHVDFSADQDRRAQYAHCYQTALNTVGHLIDTFANALG
jgi:hypothetical protein